MGKVGGVVVALVIAGVLVGLRFSNKDELAADTRVQVTELLMNLPDYGEAGAYYESLADTHHETVFDHHHKMSGRRISSSFDSMGYIHELLEEMAKDAERSNQNARAGYLRTLKSEVYIEEESG
ncbi:MAG: hypothetical protein ED559_01390 [Phycisphaera sp.]|nr:MAG: hypothetical protein ED559_01390 [Phycisphaera sp.]